MRANLTFVLPTSSATITARSYDSPHAPLDLLLDGRRPAGWLHFGFAIALRAHRTVPDSIRQYRLLDFRAWCLPLHERAWRGADRGRDCGGAPRRRLTDCG